MATTAKKAPVKKTKKPAAAKKPAVKKTAKATAAKTTSKTATKKPVKKEAVKSEVATVSTSTGKASNRRQLTPLEKIRSLHITSFISYVLLGLVTFFLVGKGAAELLLSYQARDQFTNAKGVVLGNASEVLISVEYRYILIAALVVSAVGSLLLASSLRKRYEKSLEAGISGFRWLIFGLSSAIIVELASFMAGVQDVMTLKVVVGLVLVGSLLGWLSERENTSATSPKKLAYYGSIFAYLVALLPLAGSLLGTLLFTTERFGWHVYALGALVLAGFIAVLWVQNTSIVKKSKYEYLVFETRYIRIDQLVKFIAVLILLAAVR